MSIKELSTSLKESGTLAGVEYKCDLLKDDASGDVALSLKIKGKEEFPVLVVEFDGTLICSAILFPLVEIDDLSISDFLEEILGLNVVLPQCAFAIQDEMVSIVRNMDIKAAPETVIEATKVLVSVAEDVIPDLMQYLMEEEEEPKK